MNTSFVQGRTSRIAFDCFIGSDPRAPTACLLPSTGRGPNDFIPLANDLLEKGVNVICPWPRGIGGSSGNTDTTSFEDYAADVAAVLRAQSLQGPVIVAGHAFGCWIARCVAQWFPETVDGVVLLAAAAGEWPKELSDAIDTAKSNTASKADRLAALRLAFFATGNDPSPWLDGWYPDLAAQQRAARARTEQRTWWSSGAAPVLDVIGLDDPFRPKESHDFYQNALGPRVEVHKISGASHALPYEKPEETARVLADWVRKRLTLPL